MRWGSEDGDGGVRNMQRSKDLSRGGGARVGKTVWMPGGVGERRSDSSVGRVGERGRCVDGRVGEDGLTAG